MDTAEKVARCVYKKFVSIFKNRDNLKALAFSGGNFEKWFVFETFAAVYKDYPRIIKCFNKNLQKNIVLGTEVGLPSKKRSLCDMYFGELGLHDRLQINTPTFEFKMIQIPVESKKKYMERMNPDFTKLGLLDNTGYLFILFAISGKNKVPRFDTETRVFIENDLRGKNGRDGKYINVKKEDGWDIKIDPVTYYTRAVRISKGKKITSDPTQA